MANEKQSRPAQVKYDVAAIVERDGKVITEAPDRDYDRDENAPPRVAHENKGAAESYLQSSGLIQVKVKSGGRYAHRNGGSVLWVTPREYQMVRGTLISLADEKEQSDKAAKPVGPTEAQTQFRSFRQAFRGAAKMRQEAMEAQERQRLRALGLAVGEPA